jgi:hypothetical protein
MQVSGKLRNLFDNVRYWIENKTFPPDEIAARFHRDLVDSPLSKRQWSTLTDDG